MTLMTRANRSLSRLLLASGQMLAGISDERQVSKLMLNLKDPKSFWRHDVFPSMAASEQGYKPDECTGWARYGQEQRHDH